MTTTETSWFGRLGNRAPGLETVVRSDGSYGGHCELVKETWLIECEGKRDEFATFAEFWRALSPTSEELELVLANPHDEFLHLLRRGLDCGRPISRHPLWDLMDEVEKYRDYQIHDGTLSFHVLEWSDPSEPATERGIARIDFNMVTGTHARQHIAYLPRHR